MSNLKSLEDLLKEHAALLTKLNKEMESNISCTDSEPPDYHDFQTCYEASEALKSLYLGLSADPNQIMRDNITTHNTPLREKADRLYQDGYEGKFLSIHATDDESTEYDQGAKDRQREKGDE